MADKSQEQEESPLPPRTPGYQNRYSGNDAEDRLATVLGHFLDRANMFIYAIIGMLFLVAALLALGYSTWDFVVAIRSVVNKADIAQIISNFVSELLLVLIIVEVLSTVIHSFKSHTTSIRPFLFIGIISTTRIILAVGAKLSFGELKGGDFTNALLELGMSAAVILALGITLKLLGGMVDTDTSGW